MMKASLKFREERNPLFRAKIPLSILGLPFQSGITTGDSKELSLGLSTFFDCGPSVKLSYRPNDSFNQFGLEIKTGIGHLGSPNSSSMAMKVEFNPLDLGNPRFSLHLKPQFGDFTLKKSQSLILHRELNNSDLSDDDESIQIGGTQKMRRIDRNTTAIQAAKSSAADFISDMFSGMELSARTMLPVRSGAFLKCRWGVRLPPFHEYSGISIWNLPQLVVNKISIEHVSTRKEEVIAKEDSELSFPGVIELSDAYFKTKHQMEVLRDDNEMLKKAMNDIRSEIASCRSAFMEKNKDSGKSGVGERSETRPICKSEKRTLEADGISIKNSDGISRRISNGDVEGFKKISVGSTGS